MGLTAYCRSLKKEYGLDGLPIFEIGLVWGFFGGTTVDSVEPAVG